MKSLFLLSALVIFIFTSFQCLAQSPLTYVRTSKITTTEDASELIGPPAAPSPTNPWLIAGVQGGYSLNGGDFSKNFQASGRALLEILGNQSLNKGTLLMGNLSRLTSLEDADNKSKIKELQESNQGINVGIYPYYLLGKAEANDNEYFTIYAPFSYKLNKLNANEGNENVYLNQFRAGIGFELAFLPGKTAKLPTTLSVEPAILYFDKEVYKEAFGTEESLLGSIEIDLIIPAGPGKGIWAGYSTSTQKTSQFTIGFVFVGLTDLN